MPETDDATNQAPPYADVDLFGSDLPLREAVAANGAASESKALATFGRHWGSAAMFEQAQLANQHPPSFVGQCSSRSIRPITIS